MVHPLQGLKSPRIFLHLADIPEALQCFFPLPFCLHIPTPVHPVIYQAAYGFFYASLLFYIADILPISYGSYHWVQLGFLPHLQVSLSSTAQYFFPILSAVKNNGYSPRKLYGTYVQSEREVQMRSFSLRKMWKIHTVNAQYPVSTQATFPYSHLLPLEFLILPADKCIQVQLILHKPHRLLYKNEMFLIM